jgi:hypothetical protein
MNDRSSLAQLAADALASEPLPRRPSDPDVDARIIEAMAARLQREARRNLLLKGAWGLVAAAAIVVGVRSVILAPHSPLASAPAHDSPAAAARVEGERTSLVHEGVEIALSGEAPLATGDRVRSGATGRASIRLASGGRLSLDPGTDVTVVRQGLLQMFALEEGSLRAEAGRDPVVVRTSDGAVEARGGALRVATGERAACSGRRTSVEVETGTAIVRDGAREERVEAGGRWPSNCKATETAASEASRPAARSSRDRASTHPAPPPEPSELRAQTQLFGEGVLAKRRGDTRGAVARFDEYLAAYPDSALAESAAVNRMELMARLDPARAADAARAYLLRYPRGFARDDAASIARGSP